MNEPLKTQMEAISACHRVCMNCSGGSVAATNDRLLCARYGPDFHCAVMDIEKAVHADNRQDVRDVLTEGYIAKWAGIRGLPEHDAVAVLRAQFEPSSAAEDAPAEQAPAGQAPSEESEGQKNAEGDGGEAAPSADPDSTEEEAAE